MTLAGAVAGPAAAPVVGRIGRRFPRRFHRAFMLGLQHSTGRREEAAVWGIRGERGRPSRRLLGVLILAAAIASGVSVWQLEGSTAASVPESIATASRGDIVVSVGGGGRVGGAGAVKQLRTP